MYALYEGRLENGKIFDSSLDEESPFSFTIGQGQVIKGWDIGMMSMRIGEKAELVIQSEYGYGAQGAGADIPPNATLIFKVEIIQIDDRKAKKFMVSDEELLQKGKDLKEQGNGRFKNKDFEEAAKLYNEAILSLSKIKEKNKESQELQKTCYLNLSVSTNNLGRFNETIHNCTKALMIDSQAVKAYYLRAIANSKTNNFEEAIEDIKTAIKLNPGDKALRDEFENIKALKQKKT